MPAGTIDAPMAGERGYATTLRTECGSAVRRGFARWLGRAVSIVARLRLTRLVRKIVSRIEVLAPAALALGCESDTRTRALPPPAAIVTPAVSQTEATAETEPGPIGAFNITFYYVIGEDEVLAKLAKKAAANSNSGTAELATIAPPIAHETVAIHGPSCEVIADVPKEFATQLAMQGTGKLKDGRIVNIWGRCDCERSPCFQVTERRWGTSGSGRPLQPFRTVAVDRSVIKLGTLLYVPELEGVTMPGRAPWGGFTHDGCVVADDTGGGIKGKQLDLFVGRKPYMDAISYRNGSHSWARGVAVYDGSKLCERKGRRIGRRAASI
jgi:3D (Asp-Asp-Asp) domain-containing protein